MAAPPEEGLMTTLLDDLPLIDLAPLIKVRILVPQPARLPERVSFVSVRPHRLAVRTPASHVGNTGSIPVGVAIFPSENGNLA